MKDCKLHFLLIYCNYNNLESMNENNKVLAIIILYIEYEVLA